MDQLQHMHLHNHVKRAPELTTVNGQVMSVVYVTAEPSFGGVIGSLSTSTSSSSSRVRQTASSATAQASSTADFVTGSATDATPVTSTAAVTAQSATSSLPVTQNLNPSPAASTSYNFSSSTPRLTSPASTSTSQASGASSAATTSSESSQAGTSTGQKVGIAAAVVVVVGILAVLALLLINRKKRKNKEARAREDSEKAAMVAKQQAATPSSPPTAPRLSLRPASSFLPEFMGGARPKSRLSAGNMLTSITEPKGQGQSAPQNSYQMSEKQPIENPFKDPENPFSDPAPIAVSKPLPTPLPISAATLTPPPASRTVPETTVAHSNAAASLPTPDSIAVAVTADGPHPVSSGTSPIARKPVAARAIEMPGSVPGSVAGALNPSRSAIPPPSSASAQDSSVYRVLMDFVPSMDDELELRQGQVVRLLHEYDDGWCLCTRLDRSQQGVVPRTCLASKPSKPRPQPGPNTRVVPVSTGMRSMPPAQTRPAPTIGQPRVPMSDRNSPGLVSNPARMDSPINLVKPSPVSITNSGQSGPGGLMSAGAYNQPPRPLSPGPRAQQKRSQSPGPYGAQGRPEMGAAQRRRSNSASAGAQAVRERRVTPPGPSRLGQESMGVAL